MSQHWGQNVSLCVSQYDWIGVKNFLTVKRPVLNSTKAIKCYLQHISKNILNYWLFFALCGDIKQTINIRELSFKVPKAMTETRSQPSSISSLHQKWLAIFETYFNNLGCFLRFLYNKTRRSGRFIVLQKERGSVAIFSAFLKKIGRWFRCEKVLCFGTIPWVVTSHLYNRA